MADDDRLPDRDGGTDGRARPSGPGGAGHPQDAPDDDLDLIADDAAQDVDAAARAKAADAGAKPRAPSAAARPQSREQGSTRTRPAVGQRPADTGAARAVGRTDSARAKRPGDRPAGAESGRASSCAAERQVQRLRNVLAVVSALAVVFLLVAVLSLTSGPDTAGPPAGTARELAPAGAAADADPRGRDAAGGGASSAELEEARARVAALEARLAEVTESARTLTAAVARAEDERDRLAERLRAGEPARTEAAERARALEDELARAKTALSVAETDAAAAQRERQELADRVTQLGQTREQTTQADDERRRREAELERTVAELKEELKVVDAMLPPEPLTLEEASRRFREAVKSLEGEKDHDERIAVLRDLEFTLAGTRYAAAAARLRAHEARLKQQGVDRDAAAVYRRVADRVRASPDDRAGNLRALEQALAEVKGSPRYVQAVEALIQQVKSPAATPGTR